MMLRFKKTFGFVAAVCMFGVLCGDFVSGNVHAADEIEEHGSMSVEGLNNVTWNGILFVSFTGDPAGTLTITNEATGASRRLSLRDCQSGDQVWDIFTDDPFIRQFDTYTFEFAGKTEDLQIHDAFLGVGASFSGAGYGRFSSGFYIGA
jgi:hypothetical protein